MIKQFRVENGFEKLVSHEIDNFNIWLVYGELSSKEEKNTQQQIHIMKSILGTNCVGRILSFQTESIFFHYLFLVCSSLRLRYISIFIHRVRMRVSFSLFFVQSGACLTLINATEARSTLISLAIWCLRAWITVHTHILCTLIIMCVVHTVYARSEY